ncbi:MAG: ABC transporter ATP-binding protein [Firmicutes bacterium]|nr:ABC transporter ATP-binding protein [Bacillota bacterium]
MSYVDVINVDKSYGEGFAKVKALNGVSLSVVQGEICTILGQSGSGKSTLLNAIGGLDSIDSGSIFIDGCDIAKIKGEELSDFRRDYLGFVFQFYNLVPNLTVLENIQVGEYLSNTPLPMGEILGVLGLNELQNRFPQELSGGQQQRCAIGRALVKNPKLLLCDEPTGALDFKTSKDILALLCEINEKYKTTILIVTHNETISKMAHKTVYMKDGSVHSIQCNNERIKVSEIEW